MPIQTTNTVYTTTLCHQNENISWDSFVAHLPGGYYMQSSVWAQVKMILGWKAVRIILRDDVSIVGGMQILYRPVALGFTMGYVPRGPLMATHDPLAYHTLFEHLRTVIKTQHIDYIAIQPPNDAMSITELERLGYLHSSMHYIPTTTILVNLEADIETLMAGLRQKTRQHIRKTMREGLLTVRQGTRDDIPTFYRLLLANSQRRKFNPHDQAYFQHMWDTLSRTDHLKLFIVEHQGEPETALLVLPFGDTVHYKFIGWSGHHAKLWPNELVYWEVIRWAKEHGYRQCDLEGIETAAAEAVEQGKPVPDAFRCSPTFFKLGFGGLITHTPGAFDHFVHPLYQWGYLHVFPRVANWSLVQRVIERIQTGG